MPSPRQRPEPTANAPATDPAGHRDKALITGNPTGYAARVCPVIRPPASIPTVVSSVGYGRSQRAGRAGQATPSLAVSVSRASTLAKSICVWDGRRGRQRLM